MTNFNHSSQNSQNSKNADRRGDAASQAGRSAPEVDSSLPPDFSAADGDEIAARHPSIGRYLTGQRKLRGITREDLCERTRIPMRSLERLENGFFDDIDDGFVRGFVRTVSEGLGLDPDDSVSRMVIEPTPESHREVVGRSLVRASVALAGLVFLLLSAGIVNMAIERRPVETQSHVVLRRDPVRALAKAEGLWGLSETALWAPINRATASDPTTQSAAPELDSDGVLKAGGQAGTSEAFGPAARPARLRDLLPSPASAVPERATARADESE